MKPYLFLNFFTLDIIFKSCVVAIEESFCAGLSYDNWEQKGLGLKSIGWTELKGHPLNTIWGANHAATTQPSPYNPAASPIPRSDLPNFTVRIVEDKLGAVLNGWLQISVSPNPRNPLGSFIALAIWAITDKDEVFGEFVASNIAFCNDKAPWNNRKNLVPCSASPSNEPMNPNMFVYTDPSPTPKGIQEVNILWRASVTYCNFPKQFKFMVAVNTQKWGGTGKPLESFPIHDGKLKDYGPVVYTTFPFKPKFYGAAAAAPSSKRVFCVKELKNPPVTISEAVWLRKIPTYGSFGIITQAEERFQKDRWDKLDNEIPGIAKERSVCRALQNTPDTATKKVIFGGRCSGPIKLRMETDPEASVNTTHKCKGIDVDDSTYLKETYDNYLQKRNKLLLANCACPPIPTAVEVEIIAAGGSSDNYEDENKHGSGALGRDLSLDPPANTYAVDIALTCDSGNLTDEQNNERGLCPGSFAGKIVYGVRQWHAVSLLFCVIVLNPITSYVARYLKGRFTLTADPPIPIKAWYIVHIAIILPMVCMYTTGLAAISRQSPIIGHSFNKNAKFHRRGGYFLIFVAVFQICTGFLRPIYIPRRKWVIGVHWLGGVVLNYFGLVLCILTYRIPASPTSFKPHYINKQEFNNMWKHKAAVVLTVWGMLDIFFHAFMTVHVILFDRKHKIKRPYFPVIIPILSENKIARHHSFSKEDSFQKGALIVYIIIACVSYVLTCLTIYNFNDEDEHGFGPMLCTHDKSGKFIPLSNSESKTKSSQFC